MPHIRVIACLAWASGACEGSVLGGGDGDPGTDPAPGHLIVSGTVRDLETSEALAVPSGISVDGLDPAPAASVTGADFVIDGVPPFSVFHLLIDAAPTYRRTFSAVETIDEDVLDLEVDVASEVFVAHLAESFGQGGQGGILLARAVDASGAPYAGLPATAIAVPDGAAGPYFLDAERQPDPGRTETSASGWIVFFSVAPGVVGVQAAAGADLTLEMVASPVEDASVTLGDLLVTSGASPSGPTHVSFTTDVVPIFERRACVSCHAGGGIGMALGDLHLNGEPQKMWHELVEEVSPTHGTPRVDLGQPEHSLVLTMPSREEPPDHHPIVVFTGPTDADYLLLLAWIREGALAN